MANQTVYPYGTEGTIPGGVGVVNDTYTGGANKALSAQQGVVLNNKTCKQFVLLGKWKTHDGFVSADTYKKDSATRNFGSIKNDGYDYIVANKPSSGTVALIAFVKSFSDSFSDGDSVDFCVGTERINVYGNKTLPVPSDCEYILVDLLNNSDVYEPSILSGLVENDFNEANILPFEVFTGVYDTPSGDRVQTTTPGRKCTNLIDVSDCGYIVTNMDTNNGGYVIPFWYDAEGNYLGKGYYFAIGATGLTSKIKVPQFAGKVAFTLSTSDMDISDCKIYGFPKETAVTDKDATVVYLTDFNNTSQTDSENIADMLEFVSGKSKKIIHINKNVEINEPILLESNTTVYIDNVTIKQADYMFDNVFRSANVVLPAAPDYQTMPSEIEPAQNIRIIGIGAAKIEGPDVNATYNGNEMVGDWYGCRTWQINLVRVSGGEVSGLLFTKTRGWAIEMELCENIELHELWFITTVKNGDGIDFRVGCKHCQVHDIYGYTEDDLIACTALGDLNHTEGSWPFESEVSWKLWNSLVQEDPTALYIDDISIDTCYFMGYNSSGHGMICLSAYGSKVQNVAVHRFYELADCPRSESVFKIYHGYGDGYTAGDLNNIYLNDIVCRSSDYVLIVSGGVVSDVWANKLKNYKTAANIYTQSSGNNIRVTNS